MPGANRTTINKAFSIKKMKKKKTTIFNHSLIKNGKKK